MFKNYITINEFTDFFPQASKFESDMNIGTTLNNAAIVVATDLRKMDYDISDIYIPKTFDSDVKNAFITKTDHTSGSISIGNERRLVIDVSSVTSATFGLEGSYDNSTWITIGEIDRTDFQIPISETGLHSKLFIESYPYIRYKIDGTATYSIFVVDTACDILIMYKTLEMISMGKLGYEGSAEIQYEQAKAIYLSQLKNLRIDIDEDKDGSIDTDDKNMTKKFRIRR